MEEENTQMDEALLEEETEETQDQVKEESSEDSVQSPEEDVDYKSEFERVSKQLGQAEHKLDKQRQELKKTREKTSSDIDVDSIREQVLAESKKEIEKFKEDLSKDTYESTLASITSNEDERKLIDFYYKNRITKTGFSRQDILQDLSDARILANKKRLEKTMGEMKQSMISKNTKNSQGSATSDNQSEMKDEIKLSPEQARIAKIYGLTPEEVINGIKRN